MGREAGRECGNITRNVHTSALRGQWHKVLEAISCGVDPNVPTPDQGAPPIFFASCCGFLGKRDAGKGDEARLRVLEVLSTSPKADLSLKGTKMWADGRTIFDLVGMGRCSEAALERLQRGQE